MRSERGMLQTALAGCLVGVIAFNASFVFIAYKKGLFTVNRPSAAVDTREAVSCPDYSTLLRTIEEEERVIAARGRELEGKNAELEELKKQVALAALPLEESAKKMETLARELRDGAAEADAQKEAKLKASAATFAAMKADQAVAILEKMDTKSIAAVLSRMKSKVSAKILEKMDPRKASAVMEVAKSR